MHAVAASVRNAGNREFRMQYHLNGYQGRDPAIAAINPDCSGRMDNVDVAVVGCGPAGLTLAAQLAVIGGVSVRIFDEKDGLPAYGQADGIACRSMEMFEAFGFAEKVCREAYQVSETTFWRPDADGGILSRADRIQDVEDDLSHMPHLILNQCRVQDFYLETMRKSEIRLEPDYNRRLVALTCQDGSEYPVQGVFECLDSNGGLETVQAKFLVGCDGARSMVRKFLGYELEGGAARQIWGVMDVLAVTDFPDIRLKCAIQSGDSGSMLIIPREGGYMLRMYIELGELRGDERASDRGITPEILERRARKILKPYAFEVREVVWFSAYEIGQRVCDTFDDSANHEDKGRLPRIFIAGDACHTHSPKAGQGMNVSMADAFNLGWKLSLAIRGIAKPDLLNTYSRERREKAKELIDFDRDMARLFGQKPKTPEETALFQRYFQRHGRYTAGVETTYGPSLIVGHGKRQNLAAGQVVGKRFHSAPVVRLSDARPMQLAEMLKADGRWRIVAFADSRDTGEKDGRIAGLCGFLESDANSPVLRYTPKGADIDSVIDLRSVFQRKHRDLDIGAMPKLLLPAKGRYNLVDYEKIHCAYTKVGMDVFDLRGIDRNFGALVVVRPDQFVAEVLPLDDYSALAEFFSNVLVEANR